MSKTPCQVQFSMFSLQHISNGLENMEIAEREGKITTLTQKAQQGKNTKELYQQCQTCVPR